MVAHVRSGQPERCGQLTRVARAIEERHENVAAARVSERATEPVQRFVAICKCQHNLNYTALTERRFTSGTDPCPSRSSLAPDGTISKVPRQRHRHELISSAWPSAEVPYWAVASVPGSRDYGWFCSEPDLPHWPSLQRFRGLPTKRV